MKDCERCGQHPIGDNPEPILDPEDNKKKSCCNDCFDFLCDWLNNINDPNREENERKLKIEMDECHQLNDDLNKRIDGLCKNLGIKQTEKITTPVTDDVINQHINDLENLTKEN